MAGFPMIALAVVLGGQATTPPPSDPGAQSTAADSAKTFSLDLATPFDTMTAPAPAAEPIAEPSAVSTADAPPPADVPPGSAGVADRSALPPPETITLSAPALGLDTPIGVLIDDRRGKAVLDKDLPGLSDDANLDKFRSMSLHQFQPLTGGQLTPALLTRVGHDLAIASKVPQRPAETAPVAPPSGSGGKARPDDTGR